MTREQLEGVAQRAWRRANLTPDDAAAAAPEETRVRVQTRDVEALRRAVEPRLTEHVKHWRIGAVTSDEGVESAEFFVQLKKKSTPEDLLALLRAACSDQIVGLEIF
ncbi:MAG: hypothetical protein JWL95_1285, partial [Gemmatimonadetes bacterium]|nr:hypothetical protein [Gemmatimonadota bacterium]